MDEHGLLSERELDELDELAEKLRSAQPDDAYRASQELPRVLAELRYLRRALEDARHELGDFREWVSGRPL